MTNEELREQYELFVMGIADADARDEIQARLDAGDAEVTLGVARARQLVAEMALLAPEIEPPARLKKKILSAVGRETRSFPGWMWAWASATALLALVTFNFYQREQSKARELAEVRQELVAQGARLETVSQLLEFLNEPQLKVATFGMTAQQPPKGRVLASPTRGVMLLVSNLPPAAQGRVYQMWLVPKSGAPVPAGLFQTANDGRALHVRAGEFNLAGTAAVAVSLEPESGSTAPTTTPFIIAPVAD